MNGQISRADAASWLLTLGQFGLAFAIARLGPIEPLPMHFNAEGQVDRWGDRTEMARVVMVVAVISALVAGFRWIAARSFEPEGRRGLRYAQLGVLWILSLIALLAGAMTWNWIDQPGPRLGMVMISSAVTFVGAWLGKIGPNALIGVRTPWTFGSRLAWDKANRLAGRLFFWGGLAGVIAAPFAPQPDGFHAVRFGVLAIAAIVVFESWRVWLVDPDRRRRA